MMRQPSSLAAAAMLAVALAVALAASTAAAPWERADEEVRHLYEAWKSEHGRPHGDDEDLLRLEVFRNNLRYIDAHNAEADMGLHSYRLGLTPFADLTLEEFQGRQRNDDTPFKLKSRTWYMPSFGKSSVPATDIVPATAIDWRKNGAVTGIRNQGNKCGGGSWAFSAVAAMEGVHKIATGKLVSLSEQELLDCDTKNHGCKGGRMDNAFEFVIRNGGIDSNDDYPYTGRDETCNEEKKQRKVVSIDSWRRVQPNNENALQMAVSMQPVSVAIDAGSRSFQHYTSGVFDGDCGTKADHGVIAVGYGSDNGKDYWIVKNSWGPRWGEAGYVRIARNVPQPTGKCGIAMDASFPVKKVPRADMTLLPEMALA